MDPVPQPAKARIVQQKTMREVLDDIMADSH
jgi:hypothetical protein